MSGRKNRAGAIRRHAPRARVSGEAAAHLRYTHDDATPLWARAAIDGVWDGVQFSFAVALVRGASTAELGALVVDLDTIPGGRTIDPAGGTLGLAVGREKVREWAATVDAELAAAVDVDPGENAVWMLLSVAEHGRLLARVHLRVGGRRARRGRGGRAMSTLMFEALMRGCIPGLIADYRDALRTGDGTGPDELAGLITEVAEVAPSGMTATTACVYSRAAMIEEFEGGQEEGVRALGAKLRAWKAPAPGFLPVVVCVGALVGVVPVRLTPAVMGSAKGVH